MVRRLDREGRDRDASSHCDIMVITFGFPNVQARLERDSYSGDDMLMGVSERLAA